MKNTLSKYYFDSNKQFLRKMRTTSLMLILSISSLFATNVKSQITKVSFAVHNASILNVIEKIESQTDYLFVYNENEIELDRKVTISATNQSVAEILSEIFNNTNIVYAKEGTNIMLMQKSVSQQQKIIGTVTDEKNNLLPGVTVLVKGTTNGTLTDASGKYTLNNVPQNATLIFTFVGMITQEIATTGKMQVDVVLKEAVLSLDEVIVTGYSTQRKKDITGAVTVVDMKSFKSLPTGSGVVALQGQASGVSVISNGAPGSASQIFIRGIGSFGDTNPLVLVDGVEASLDEINANEIESMQVLKDAGSAAIYGVRGSNGVIVVTTKKGKSGTPVVTYDAYAGVQMPFSGNPLNMSNSADYAKMYSIAFPADNAFTNGIPDYMYRVGSSEAHWANAGDPAVDPSKYNFDASNPINNYIIAKVNKSGTNWYQEVFKPALMTNQNLAVSGGSDKARYMFSLNYLNQKGTLIETVLKRFSVKINTDFNIGKNIRIGENLYIYSTTNNGYGSNTNENNAIMQCIRSIPLIPVYDIQGHFAGGYSLPIMSGALNPVALQKMTNNNKNNTWVISGNAYAEADFLKHFTARTSFGGSFRNNYSTYFDYNHYFDVQNFSGLNSLQVSFGNDLYGIWTNTLNYSNTFGKHKLVVLAGSEAVQYSGSSLWGTRTDFFSSDIDYLLLQNGNIRNNNASGAYINTLSSLFGRLDYSFGDKYLLGLTARRDGSSKFSAESRYGVFPSASLGWRISEESFMKNNFKWINDLKLRASYGVLGSQANVDNANAFTLFGTSINTSYYDIDATNNGSQQGFYQTRIGNTNTSWEKDVVSNFGLDATILNSKVDFSVEYYKKSINGLLFPEPLPATVGGAASPSINIGDIQNTGFDISANYRDKIGQDLNFTIGANMTSYNNKIMSIPGSAGYFDDGSNWRTGTLCRNQQGHPVSSFFGYDVIGLFQSDSDVAASPIQQDAGPGQFKYRDVNGDGKITPEDRTFIGNPNPKFTYGINLGLNYKNFDFSAVFYGSQGNKVYNLTKWYSYFTSYYKNGLSNDLLNAWTTTKTNTTVPVLIGNSSFSENGIPNSWYIEDGSFLKCRLLTLGYSLPANVLEKLKIKKLRVYLQVANPFQITKYSGLDPEVQGQTSAFGIDWGNYPNNQKQFLAGVNVTF
jgi:TonB-dependent starch-binding outer membrane protein SusC